MYVGSSTYAFLSQPDKTEYNENQKNTRSEPDTTLQNNDKNKTRHKKTTNKITYYIKAKTQ